ncbi:MAG: hypothetical protein IJP41_07130 [Synergistaceae bacterium]|nr:hypothetical protein [Synergistaceae bacterium]
MSLEDFKKLHAELGQALEDYEVNEQKRNEQAQEILSGMYDIAKESERVADVARDVPKMLEKNSRLKKIFYYVLVILAFLIFAVEHFVTDKLVSFILLCILLVAGFFTVKFLWKLRRESQEKIFTEIREKIRGEKIHN